MKKFSIALTLTGSLLAFCLPSFGTDAKQPAAAPPSAGSTSGNDSAVVHGDHPHYPHEWTPSKRDIMGISDLTDKQKNDLAAIYSDSAPQYAAIEMEYHDLRKKIWEKAQTVLTPAQADALRDQRQSRAHAAGAHKATAPVSALDRNAPPPDSSK